MLLYTTLAVLLAQAAISAAQQINTCPTTETTQYASDGSYYQTCFNSDYQGQSTLVQGGVNDVAACAELCSKTAGCTQSVFDHTYKYCHVKGNGLTWTTSNQFDTMRFIKKVAPGTTITNCPVPETTQTVNSQTFAICPYTDYQGASKQIINNIANINDCVKLCTGTCTKAVFDNLYNVCHLKADGGTFNWVSSKQYSSVRVTTGSNPTVPDGTQISKCPVAETTQTIGAKTYVLCPNTDYQGGSKEVINNVADVAECARLCTATTCAKAVFDNYNKVCHLKADGVTLTWATSKQFDSMIVTTTTNPAKFGKWSNIINVPVIPVAAYVVPAYPESSRILAFSSYANNDFGGENGMTQFTDYNFKTGAVSQRTVANTKHDMFCPGMSSLTDGRLVISGGSDAAKVSIYDPSTNAFTSGPNMQIARGYQTSATLSNGKIFTIGGSYAGGIGGKDGEIYDPTSNTWTKLSGALVANMLTSHDHEGAWRTDNHGWLFGWKDGSVFQAGPSKQMNWYTTSGNGGVKAAGTRDIDDAMCGVHAMYDAVNGKIFSAAGAPEYTDNAAVVRAHSITIGTVGNAATVERLPDLTYPRGFANAAILPDGTVLVTGGQRISRVFTDFESMLAPELFDPKTKKFTVLTPGAVPRNYHSVSLLLPDATVLVGGGGLCYSPAGANDGGCNRAVDHSNFEIFTPPYLFKPDGSAATRPVISSLSSSVATNGYSARLGGTMTVTMSNISGGMTFSLLRIGSVTHSVNSDQRRVPLTNVVQNGAKWTITLPGDAGVMIPGTWYLFAISADGVPGMAKTVKVTA